VWIDDIPSGDSTLYISVTTAVATEFEFFGLNI
jgi:hypothetical protein